MPIEQLVLWVVVGLAITVGGIVKWGLSPRRAPLTEESAAEIFGKDHAEAEVERCLVSVDGTTALLELQNPEQLGLISEFCGKYTCRLISRDDISEVTENDEGVITLKFGDYTYPRHVLNLGEQKEQMRVCEMLKKHAAA